MDRTEFKDWYALRESSALEGEILRRLMLESGSATQVAYNLGYEHGLSGQLDLLLLGAPPYDAIDVGLAHSGSRVLMAGLSQVLERLIAIGLRSEHGRRLG